MASSAIDRHASGSAEYGPQPPLWQCGCAGQITALKQEIGQLHRLFEAGEICESTYRLHLRHMEAQLELLTRPS
jgi:hypothetical protein